MSTRLERAQDVAIEVSYCDMRNSLGIDRAVHAIRRAMFEEHKRGVNTALDVIRAEVEEERERVHTIDNILMPPLERTRALGGYTAREEANRVLSTLTAERMAITKHIKSLENLLSRIQGAEK